MKTKCPNCLAVYSIATAAEKQLGRIARCGKCQQTFPLFAWEGNVTAGESFEALLEEFLLPLGPQRVGATENEPDENSGMSSLPAPQAGEQEAPQEPLLTRPQEEAGLPQQIRPIEQSIRTWQPLYRSRQADPLQLHRHKGGKSLPN